MPRFPENKYRRLWLPELLGLLALTLAAIILFRDASLDLWAAHLFYHPENLRDSWVEAHQPLWDFFYRAAPWITGVLLLGSLATLILAQIRPQYKGLRIGAIFIFLVIAIGPGLLVNSVFKPYWGRPRPREVIELGGRYEYRPYYSPALGQPGKSFPCGHCSVGFAYGSFFWIFRRRKRWLGVTALAGSAIFGGFMGIGRIADGAHFFSDVIWAALISWYSAFWLYHFVLKIPQREDHSQAALGKVQRVGQFLERKKPLVYSLYAALGVLTVIALLLASPFYKDLELNGAEKSIESLSINIDQADVVVELDATSTKSFAFLGFTKGFGFPKNHVDIECTEQDPTTNCSITRHGFFSDYESNLKIIINPTLIKFLHVNLRKGDLSYPKTDLPSTYQFTQEKN